MATSAHTSISGLTGQDMAVTALTRADAAVATADGFEGELTALNLRKESAPEWHLLTLAKKSSLVEDGYAYSRDIDGNLFRVSDNALNRIFPTVGNTAARTALIPTSLHGDAVFVTPSNAMFWFDSRVTVNGTANPTVNSYVSFGQTTVGIVPPNTELAPALGVSSWRKEVANKARIDIREFGLVLDGSDETELFIKAVQYGIPLLIAGGNLGLAITVVSSSNVDIEIASNATITMIEPQSESTEPDLKFTGSDVRFVSNGLINGNDTGRTSLSFFGERATVYIHRIINTSIITTSNTNVSCVSINGSGSKAYVRSDSLIRNGIAHLDNPTTPRTISVENSAKNVTIEAIGGTSGGSLLVLGSNSSGRVLKAEAINITDNGIYILSGAEWTVDLLKCTGTVPECLVINGGSITVNKMLLRDCVSISALGYQQAPQTVIESIEITGNSYFSYLIGARPGNVASGNITINNIIGTAAVNKLINSTNGTVSRMSIDNISLDQVFDNTLLAWDGSAVTYSYGLMLDIDNIDEIEFNKFRIRILDSVSSIPSGQVITYPLGLNKKAKINSFNVTKHLRDISGVITDGTDFSIRGARFFSTKVELNADTLYVQTLSGSSAYARERTVDVIANQWLCSGNPGTGGINNYYTKGRSAVTSAGVRYECIASGTPGTWIETKPTLTGTTASRPASPIAWQKYNDSTLGYEITYNGTNWVNGVGTTV